MKAESAGTATLIRLEIDKRKAMADFIRDMTDRGMTVDAAVTLSKEVFDA